MRNFSLLLQNVYCLCGSSANEAYWIFASSKLTVLTQGNIFLLTQMVPFTAYNCAPAWIFPACRSSLHLVQCLSPAGTRPWFWLWGGRCTLPQSKTQSTRWAERWWDGNEAADVKEKESAGRREWSEGKNRGTCEKQISHCKNCLIAHRQA